MTPNYKLEEVKGKPSLYHLKVKDNNNLLAETNLFFDLKEEPPTYDSFVVSQSDDEYIHNFKGLIIEPSNLSVDINVDVSSKISILKADQGVLGKEGVSVVELPDEPVTLLINKELDFKGSENKINIGRVDLVASNSEFYKVNASFETTYNLISEIKIDSCIFKRDVDITTSKKANISASSFYSSSLSKVSLIENSSFEDFKGDSAIYKNFNSVTGETAEPEINKDVGVVTQGVEPL